MFLLDIFLIPISWWYTIAFIFGIIIGSFLNVYIYRFHTGKSLSGNSHCMSCGTRLRWFELFPLLSYLALRARCSTCGCKITPRYFLVELGTGLLFLLTLTLTTDIVVIGLLWFICSVLVVITVYDLHHFIIPDGLTITLTVSAIGLLVYENIFLVDNIDKLIGFFGAAILGSVFFLLLWVVSKGKWLGFGDVKLAFPLGLLVGPAFVFSFVVLSFWVGAAISLLFLAWAKIKSGKAPLHLSGSTLTMKSAVPFAPFLVVSCLIILFTNFNVLELFSFI